MKLPRYLFEDSNRVFTFKWLRVLINSFLKEKRLLIARKKLKHEDRGVQTCTPINNPAMHRPDPLIYSQKYLLSLGLAVTWDNPDIVLLRNGVIVPEGSLLPDTDYEIDATIWNNSFDTPVIGLLVEFSYLSFGAGTTLNSIGSSVINLGVKGGINHPAHARITWRTPPAGHYCIQVDLKPADDLNASNNLGQNNVQVVSPQSPAIFSFQVKNNTPRESNYTFPIDTYILPILKDCEEKETGDNDNKNREEIWSLHDRTKYPVPSDWTIQVSPTSVTLPPGQETSIQVSVDPPINFTGTKAFNIHALRDQGLFDGGITFYVLKP